MADAEVAHRTGTAGRRDEHRRAPEPGGQASGPLRRPGSDGEHALQQRMGTTTRADRFYDQQVLDHLNERMREFVRTQEMFFLATADRHGECDNTFRAGPPGFLRVLDDRTLLYPEYRGNGVLASLGNLQENPHVGLLLMDFSRARIGLHVNGRAEVCEDAEIRAEIPDLPVDPVPGRRAQLWVRVHVEEAYIHCAKHIPHLQKVPKGAGREWGTDDHKRKGGDFFGSARDAKERGPVEWEPREHETPKPAPAPPPDAPARAEPGLPAPEGPAPAGPAPAAPVGSPAQDPVPPASDTPAPAAEPPFTPAPVLAPGQVPAPPSVPPSVPPAAPSRPPAAPAVAGHAPEPEPAVAHHQGPRHARARPAHQTPMAAWRARRQAAAADAPPAQAEPGVPGQVAPAYPRDVPPVPGASPEPRRHGDGGGHAHAGAGPDVPSPHEPYPGDPYAAYGAATPSAAYAAHVPDGYRSSYTAREQHASGVTGAASPEGGGTYGGGAWAEAGYRPDAGHRSEAGHDESYAAGWYTVGRRGSGSDPDQVPSGQAPPGAGAAAGASAVIAARGAVQDQEDPDPEAWRLEAERALADAQRRAASEESSFQGWFG